MTGLALGALCADLARVYHFTPGSGDGQLVTKHPWRKAFVVSLLDETVDEFVQFEIDHRAVASYQDEATVALVARLFRKARAEVDARVTDEEPWAGPARPEPRSAIRASLGAIRYPIFSKPGGGW